MSDIDSLSASAYAAGIDPIDYAISLIEIQIQVTAEVASGREVDPTTYPAWGNRPLTDEATARRIVAALLNAGWTPPPARPPVV